MMEVVAMGNIPEYEVVGSNDGGGCYGEDRCYHSYYLHETQVDMVLLPNFTRLQCTVELHLPQPNSNKFH